MEQLYTRRDFKDLGRNLSLKGQCFSSLFKKFFSISATFSTGILEKSKGWKIILNVTEIWVKRLLEDLFVDPAAKVDPMFTKKSLNDSLNDCKSRPGL